MRKANKASKMVEGVKVRFKKEMEKAKKAVELFNEQVQDNNSRISFLNSEIGTLKNQNVKIEKEKEEALTFQENMDKFLNKKL